MLPKGIHQKTGSFLSGDHFILIPAKFNTIRCMPLPALYDKVVYNASKCFVLFTCPGEGKVVEANLEGKPIRSQVWLRIWDSNNRL